MSVFSLALFVAIITKPLLVKESLSPSNPQVLGDTTALNASQNSSELSFNIKVPAKFTDNATFEKSIDILGSLTASNILYSLEAGEGVSISSGQSPTIKNTGVLTVQGKSGNLSLESGSGISLDGLKITNSDSGSSQNIFKTIAVTDGDDISASSNSDKITFVPGAGISITSDSTNKKITIGSNVAGWTVAGTYLYPTTISHNVGIGTSNPTAKLYVSGNTIISSGLNLLGSGIINAGAIVDATGLTSSGNITFSSLHQGIVKTSALGLLSSSSISLSSGSSDISGVLSINNGGTGLNSYLKGDLIYASANNVLASLGAGADGNSLIISNGVPAWGTADSSSGQPCANCLITNPNSTQNLVASSSSATGLSIRQANEGAVDIFNIKNYSGDRTFLKIDSVGQLGLGQSSSSKIGNFILTTLTDDRTYTLPDISGNICLDTGNCAGLGSNIGGSGSQGYLSRWSSQYSIENSSIYDNGNIGIGTATPSAKLDVVGTSNFSGTVSLGGILGVSGATTLSSTLGVSGATTLSSTLNVTSNITSGGALKIDGVGDSYVLGDLGIGTISPSAKLDVSGTGNFSGALTLGSTIEVTGTATFSSTITSNGNITSTGNIGVGTTSPNAKVDIVQSTTSPAFNITADSITSGTGSTLSFDGLTSGNGLYIQSTSASITSGKLVNIDETQTRTDTNAMTNNALAINRSITYNPEIPTITKDNQTENISSSAVSTLSLSHAISTTSNMVLVAHVSLYHPTSGKSVTAITYNGVAMTLLGSAASTGNYTRSYIYYMIAPPTGTNTLTVTASGTCGIKLGAVSWYNVNQSTPFGTAVTAGSSTGSSSSLTVTSDSHDIVIDNYTAYGGSSTPGDGQDILWSSVYNSAAPMAASTKPGASPSVVMSWTGNNNYMSHVAASIKPSSSSNLNVQGALASLSSNCSGQGTCSDSASLLSLNQLNSAATGGIISIINSGLGASLVVNDDGTSTDNTPFIINADGNVGMGTATPSAKLHISADYGGNAALIINQLASGNIFSATSSGTTVAFMENNGDLTLGSGINGGNTAPAINLYSYNSGAARKASLKFIASGQIGIYNSTDAGYQILIGQSPSYTNAGYINGSNYLQIRGGVANKTSIGLATTVLPKNVLDVGGNLSVGSYSGVNTAPTNGLIVSGQTGIGTASPIAALDIESGYGGNAALIVNNPNNGELFTASSSGTTKFTISKNGLVNASAGGLATFIKAGTVSDSDFTDTAVDGALAVDSSDNRMYVRSGGTWKYIAFTEGFQVPNFEAANFSEGDLLLPYVEKKMADGAIHGLYMKFSDAPEIASISANLANKVSIADFNLLSSIVENLKNLVQNIQNQINDLITRLDIIENNSSQPTEQICLGTTEQQTCVTKDQLDSLIKIIPTPTASPSANLSTASATISDDSSTDSAEIVP